MFKRLFISQLLNAKIYSREQGVETAFPDIERGRKQARVAYILDNRIYSICTWRMRRGIWFTNGS